MRRESNFQGEKTSESENEFRRSIDFHAVLLFLELVDRNHHSPPKAANLAKIDKYNVERIYKKENRFSKFLPFLINEIGIKDKLMVKNLDIGYRFETLFSDIKNYNV